MIPFVDLKQQYASIRHEILPAIEKLLASSQFVLGDEVKTFEEEFASFSGAKHGIGVNNGTSALHLALLAAGVKPGDEVITVPLTFVASVAAIGYTGARAVLVDVDPRSYTMDPARLEAAITPRTKAIMPVHLYGQPADMDPILEIARLRGIPVIEDAAQAHGAEYRGRRCGSMGFASGFSFYPGKNLGAYGEGGLITTSDAGVDRMCRILRDWGQERKYHHDIRGFNARLEGIQGAVLRVKLRHLEAWTEARRRLAEEYLRQLSDCDRVGLPQVYDDRRHVFHIFAVRVPDRPGFMKFLQDRGVQTAIHYPIPVHLLKGYSDLGYAKGDFPVSEKIADEVVSLPMFPELTREQVGTVADTVKQWCRS